MAVFTYYIGVGCFVFCFWATVIDFFWNWSIDQPKFVVGFILSSLALVVVYVIDVIDEVKTEVKME